MSREEFDLEGLSEEERAALAEGGDEDEDNTPADATDELDEGADDEHDSGADDEPVPAVAPTAPEPAAAAEPAATETVPPAVDHVAKAQEARDALAALKAQFGEGEVDIEEFTAEFERLSVELQTAEVARRVEEHAARREQEAAASAWQTAQDRFMAQDGNALFNAQNKAAFNEVAFDALDVQVQKLSRDPANAKLGYDELLAKASQRVREAFNLNKPTARPQKREQPSLPPNLGTLPAAAPNAHGGRFEHLDAMGGMELESALAKMSDAERDAYEQSL